jgi:hypothetical protein
VKRSMLGSQDAELAQLLATLLFAFAKSKLAPQPSLASTHINGGVMVKTRYASLKRSEGLPTLRFSPFKYIRVVRVTSLRGSG